MTEIGILVYRDREGRLCARVTREDGQVTRYVQARDAYSARPGYVAVDDMRDALADYAFEAIDDLKRQR